MWARVTDSGPTLPSFGSKHRDRTVNMQVPFVCMWRQARSSVGTGLAHGLLRWISVVPALGGRISCFVVMTMGAVAQ